MIRKSTVLPEADPGPRDPRPAPSVRERRAGPPTRLLAFIACVSATPPLVAQTPDCEQWNTQAFFESATAEDVTACLTAGANPMARGHADVTLLHQAVQYSQDPAVIQVLVDSGADPDARMSPHETAPLHLAETAAAVHALLRAGADVDVTSRGGATPLYVAVDPVASRTAEVIQALLAGGADPLAWVWGGDPSKTPLAFAEDPAVIELLQGAVAAAGRDCNLWNTARFWKGTTLESVTNCLEAGFSPRGAEGLSEPLFRAAAHTDDPSVVRLLIDAGADVNAGEGVQTPLHRAIASNTTTLPTIQALLDAGADIEARNRRGNTALHQTLLSASSLYNLHRRASHYAAVVQLLLEAGADIEARNRFDWTVWEAAQFFSHGLANPIGNVLRNAVAKGDSASVGEESRGGDPAGPPLPS